MVILMTEHCPIPNPIEYKEFDARGRHSIRIPIFHPIDIEEVPNGTALVIDYDDMVMKALVQQLEGYHNLIKILIDENWELRKKNDI